MSENLKQFFDLMNNDPEIKEKALTCNELGKEKVRLALIELAKESGIELSEADFVEQPVESEELDMEELGAVVGGGSRSTSRADTFARRPMKRDARS